MTFMDIRFYFNTFVESMIYLLKYSILSQCHNAII